MQQFNNMDPEYSSEGDADRQAVERMTRVCEAFRRDLQENRLARLEDFLDQIPQTLRAEALPRLLTIEDQHRVATNGKRLSNDEVLARFPNSPDREIVEAWLGRRTTEVFAETKVEREEQRSQKEGKRYSSEDFPGLELLEKVGSGGQGQVYRVFDQRCRTLRALKIFEAAEGQGRTYGSDPLNREAEHLARLRDRGAAVLTVHHAGETERGVRYLVMDYCKHGSLEDWLENHWDEDRDRPTLKWQECADLVAKLARTLQVVHAEGLYHLDIKPQNILIGNDGQPLLADFAGSTAHLDFHRGANFGFSRFYAAPEILAIQNGASPRADGRSDLFSLGVVFYQLLTGVLFTEGTRHVTIDGVIKVSGQSPQPARQLQPAIPREVDQVCQELLQPDFDLRISSAKDVADRLEAALRRDANPPMKRVKTAAMWGGWGGYLMAFYMFLVALTEPAMTGQELFEKRGCKLNPIALDKNPPPAVEYDVHGDEARVTIHEEGNYGFVEFVGIPSVIQQRLELSLDLTQELKAGNSSRPFYLCLGLHCSQAGSYQFAGIQLDCMEIKQTGEKFRVRGSNREQELEQGDRTVDVRIGDFSLPPTGLNYRTNKDEDTRDLQFNALIRANGVHPRAKFELRLIFTDGFLTKVMINQSTEIDVPECRFKLQNDKVGLLLEPNTVSLSPPRFN